MGVSRSNMRGRGRNRHDRVALAKQLGLRASFRSNLEAMNAKWLKDLGVDPIRFEDLKVPYTVPSSERSYNPDFVLPNGIIVEVKGKLEPKDRAKHVLIKAQHPGLDIRFVFQRPTDPIRKGSPTSYGQWATANGFQWATKVVPKAWVQEKGPARQPEEVLGHG